MYISLSLYIYIYIYMYVYVYIYIYIYIYMVNTNGAAEKVMSFDRLGKKVRPGTFGNIEVG